MDQRAGLLREMNDGHYLLLIAMADLEEEEDQPKRARGWRWLAERWRWPIEVDSSWEWWRAKEEREYQCSLPRLMMEHVRKLANTPKGETCRFESASQALGCAATVAAGLLDFMGSIDD